MSQRNSQAEHLCPLCGAERSPWGCRAERLGDWCTVYGLKEDVSRTRPPAPEQPEERDPSVRAAVAALTAAQRQYDDATARWEQIALAGLQAKSKRYTAPMVTVDGQLVDVVPVGSRHEDLRRHAEAEAEADHDRRTAGERVVAARQALDDTRDRVRRHRARQPA